MAVGSKQELLGKKPDAAKLQAWGYVLAAAHHQTVSLEAWARTEGDLIRALMSHVLERNRRNPEARLMPHSVRACAMCSI